MRYSPTWPLAKEDPGGEILLGLTSPGLQPEGFCEYHAEVEDIWDACTNPERIRRWFLPISGDLREGGRLQLEGNASGTIQRCTPPHGFSAMWEYGGEVSWIELRAKIERPGSPACIATERDVGYRCVVPRPTNRRSSTAHLDLRRPWSKRKAHRERTAVSFLTGDLDCAR